MQFINEPKHLVNPVRDLKMFDTPIVEYFSKTPWYAIPIVYLPPIVYFFLQSYSEISLFMMLSCFIFGCFWWTFCEYYLHRFLFHAEDSWLPNYPSIFFMHFFLHGIHHAYPMDRMRLVFPPIPGYVIHWFLIIQPLKLFIGEPYIGAVVSGILTFYVFYDLGHYYMHHASPKSGYFKDLKRYHMLHHYKQGTIGFGVSNKLWDFIFGTEIKY